MKQLFPVMCIVALVAVLFFSGAGRSLFRSISGGSDAVQSRSAGSEADRSGTSSESAGEVVREGTSASGRSSEVVGVEPASTEMADLATGAPSEAPSTDRPMKPEDVPTDESQVTPRERTVLAMYGSIADALDTHADSCSELGRNVEQIVTENSQAVAQWAAEQKTLSAVPRDEANARLERAAAGELTRLRRSLREGIARCPNETRLQKAIATLAGAQRS